MKGNTCAQCAGKLSNDRTTCEYLSRAFFFCVGKATPMFRAIREFHSRNVSHFPFFFLLLSASWISFCFKYNFYINAFLCFRNRNGHMLTHRNKKPYECKAEGCGKSYCDARSLRRHTENHHTGSNASSTGGTREVTSPLASSCIQYAPPTAYQPSQYPTSSSPASSTTTTSSTPTKAPSHLQQLLASDSTTSATSTASSTKVLSMNEWVNKKQNLCIWYRAWNAAGVRNSVGIRRWVLNLTPAFLSHF